MLNLKREYFTLENERYLYPCEFTDKAKCTVYGRKKFITEAGEEELSAHVFEISKDFWTFNAGSLDFTNYPDGIWNDYISVDIVERDEYTNPAVNFTSLGDITPENLQELMEYFTKHISDLEKRIVEDYLYIDEGVAENKELPNLPENHFWVRKNGVIVGVNLDYLKKDYEYLRTKLETDFKDFQETTYQEMLKQLAEDYKKLIIQASEDILKISNENIVEIKKAVDLYFETDVKTVINQYIDEQKIEILKFIGLHKEDLIGPVGPRGLSIGAVEFSQDVLYGKEYNVFLENGNKLGTIIAPKGEPGAQGEQGVPGENGTAVVVPIKGQYIFQIENGNLVCYYEGETAPQFTIENGNLVLTIDE